MATKPKYHVKQAVTVDLGTEGGAVKFTAGDHSPKDDHEAEALEHLVMIKAATRVRAPKEEE